MRVGDSIANMPGSFVFEIPKHACPSFYQTPTSQSAQTPSTRDGTLRKRARYNTAPAFDGPGDDDVSYFSNAHESWSNQVSAQSTGAYEAAGIESPSSLVYSKYQLKYGPDMLGSAMSPGDDAYGDKTFRQTRYRDTSALAPSPLTADATSFQTPEMLVTENNGRKRGSAALTASPSWSRSVIGAVGGVAGKVLSFCWTASSGAFRGFYAGGGKSYPMSAPSGTSAEQTGLAQDDVFGLESQPTQQILPGQFPEESAHLGARPVLNLTAPTTLPHDPEWVLIRNSPGASPSLSRESSPASHTHRKIPRTSSYGHTRRPSSPSKLQAQTSYTSNVSVAFSPRPVKRLTRTSTSGSPSYHKRASSSLSQPVRPSTPTTAHESSQRSPTSPASIEAKKLAAKMRKREKQEDASLRRLNDQLQAMIREGKQALGTKFEVDDFEDEEEVGMDEGIGMDLDEEYHA